jgi:general secretion pathway protein M
MKWLAPWQLKWQSLAARERRLVLAALWLLGALVMWWLALAPALGVRSTAPARHLALDAQLQQMQQLKAQAQALQAQPVLPADQLRPLVEAALKPLGAALQISQQGERITVSFKGLSPDALAQCLLSLRESARTAPAEAHLLRNAAQTWDGTLVILSGAQP